MLFLSCACLPDFPWSDSLNPSSAIHYFPLPLLCVGLLFLQLAISNSGCTCGGNAWTNATAQNGAACVKALLGKFSDGGDACTAGGGNQEYAIVKDSAVQAAVASGVLRGSNYIEGGAYTTGATEGGSQVRIKGSYLFPNDMHAASAASVTNVQRMTGPDVTLNLQYLEVLVGGKKATGCTLYTYPRGVDPAAANRSIGSDSSSSDLSGFSGTVAITRARAGP